nr:hypothetical protein BaRGS_009599 [Batillaria attramentaria]
MGEEEERAPQADLEEELALRAARLRPDMGGGQDLRQGQKEQEKEEEEEHEEEEKNQKNHKKKNNDNKRNKHQ